MFTFCQDGQCCSTGGLPAQERNCHQNDYNANELGDCGHFKFIPDSMQGNVTYLSSSATDGWKGEWLKLVLDENNSIKCLINQKIDTDDDNEPSSLEFNCNLEGKHFVFWNVLPVQGCSMNSKECFFTT